MTEKGKMWVVVSLPLVVGLVAICLPKWELPQHISHYADTRTMFGIANGANVLSCLAIGLPGALGLWEYFRRRISVRESVIYLSLFTSVLFMAFASAFWHWRPNDFSMVFYSAAAWLLAISILAAVISEWITRLDRLSFWMPFFVLGVFNIFFVWYVEKIDVSNLRSYALVNYLPVLSTALIVIFFGKRGGFKGTNHLMWAICWVWANEIFQVLDMPIYHFTGFASGHMLGHFALAGAACHMVAMFKERHPLSSGKSIVE